MNTTATNRPDTAGLETTPRPLIALGVAAGYRELLAALRAELADQDARQPKTILTGGLSGAPWAGEIPGVDAIDPEVTLRGLAILHAEVSAARQPSTQATTPA